MKLGWHSPAGRGVPALGVFAGVVLTAALAGSDPGARLVADQPVFDFGTVERGARVEHVFRLPNRGNAPLRLDHVKGSCGCTVAVVSAQVIEAGAEGRVAVTLDTSSLAGRTSKVMSVYTDDPSQPVMSLTLVGTVRADLVLAPNALYLGRVRRGERVRREVTITPGGSPPHSVIAVDPPSSALRVALEPAADASGQRLVVELAPDAPLGHFNEDLRLRTTSPTSPSMLLTVFGTIEGDVLVLPPQVSFGVTRGASAPERELLISNRGARPFAVTRVAVPEGLLTYELSPLDPGHEYRLRLRLRDGLKPGKVEGTVEIFTDHPAEGRVVVPLSAIIRATGRRG